MMVKPPLDADWQVRDAVDTIDFLPTIAMHAGAGVPLQCRGRPLQSGPIDARTRITERIAPDWYNIAIEQGNAKAIFTYESKYPERPECEDIISSPELSEFYDLTLVRDERYVRGDVSEDQTESLQKCAEEFLTETDVTRSNNNLSAPMPPETQEQLRLLGYK